jgi:hypothetical protein
MLWLTAMQEGLSYSVEALTNYIYLFGSEWNIPYLLESISPQRFDIFADSGTRVVHGYHSKRNENLSQSRMEV